MAKYTYTLYILGLNYDVEADGQGNWTATSELGDEYEGEGDVERHITHHLEAERGDNENKRAQTDY